MSVNIDMTDPGVQRLMGQGADAITAQRMRERELVHIAGDAPDPTGKGPNGSQTTYRLNRAAIAHPLVAYKDYVLETDVYAHPGEPMVVHLICPRCHHALTIPETKKAIDLELGAGPNGQGKLSIEPFECTWEMPEAGEHTAGLVTAGTTLCRWKAGISNNIAKDA